MDTALARQLLVAEARRLAGVHDLVAAHGDTTPEARDGQPDPAFDAADAASDLLEAELDEALMVAVDDERADIAHALARLDDGTYGTCETCRTTIPDERLFSVPATRFCVTCEAMGERDALAWRAPGLDPARRAALRDLTEWTDDGDTGPPPAEESAVHAEPGVPLGERRRVEP